MTTVTSRPQYLNANNQLYTAWDLRRVFDSYPLGEGAHDYEGFRVLQRQAGATMSVDVGKSAVGEMLAYVRGDSRGAQGLYAIDNIDRTAPTTETYLAQLNVTVSAADGSNPRLDQVVLEVLDSQHVGSTDTSRLRTIDGTATSGATFDNRTGAAALPASSLLLADILVPTSAASIVTADIRDRRPFSHAAGGVVPPVLSAATFAKDMVALHPGPGTVVDYDEEWTHANHDLDRVAGLFWLPRRIKSANRIKWSYGQKATALAGNYRIGIYDASGRLIVETGSTAFTGANGTIQRRSETITATTLEAGPYYVYIAADTSAGSAGYVGLRSKMDADEPGSPHEAVTFFSDGSTFDAPTTLSGFTTSAPQPQRTTRPPSPSSRSASSSHGHNHHHHQTSLPRGQQQRLHRLGPPQAPRSAAHRPGRLRLRELPRPSQAGRRSQPQRRHRRHERRPHARAHPRRQPRRPRPLHHRQRRPSPGRLEHLPHPTQRDHHEQRERQPPHRRHGPRDPRPATRGRHQPRARPSHRRHRHERSDARQPDRRGGDPEQRSPPRRRHRRQRREHDRRRRHTRPPQLLNDRHRPARRHRTRNRRRHGRLHPGARPPAPSRRRSRHGARPRSRRLPLLPAAPHRGRDPAPLELRPKTARPPQPAPTESASTTPAAGSSSTPASSASPAASQPSNAGAKPSPQSRSSPAPTTSHSSPTSRPARSTSRGSRSTSSPRAATSAAPTSPPRSSVSTPAPRSATSSHSPSTATSPSRPSPTTRPSCPSSH